MSASVERALNIERERWAAPHILNERERWAPQNLVNERERERRSLKMSGAQLCIFVNMDEKIDAYRILKNIVAEKIIYL